MEPVPHFPAQLGPTRSTINGELERLGESRPAPPAPTAGPGLLLRLLLGRSRDHPRPEAVHGLHRPQRRVVLPPLRLPRPSPRGRPRLAPPRLGRGPGPAPVADRWLRPAAVHRRGLPLPGQTAPGPLREPDGRLPAGTAPARTRPRRAGHPPPGRRGLLRRGLRQRRLRRHDEGLASQRRARCHRAPEPGDEPPDHQGPAVLRRHLRRGPGHVVGLRDLPRRLPHHSASGAPGGLPHPHSPDRRRRRRRHPGGDHARSP